MFTEPALTDRRAFLYHLGAGLGNVALTALLARQRAAGGPLVARPAHHPARAKACIFLTMEGGPSHLDTFDPKPKLDQIHMQEFVRRDKFASAMESGTRYYVRSPFRFRKAGKSGMDVCEHYER